MPLPVSKKQAASLGKRLVTEGRLSADDAALFQSIIDNYDLRMTQARDRVEAAIVQSGLTIRADLTVTGRTKTTLTLRQKLARTPDVGLPYIRDIAGVRVVGDMLLDDQDFLAGVIRAEFGSGGEAKVVDRRAEPVSGYRALHLVVTCDDVPVEVQIRTEMQALWADLYERQADLWGRQIRYGDPPDPDLNGATDQREAFLRDLVELSLSTIAEFEQARNSSRPTPQESYDETERRMRALLRQRTKASLAEVTRLKVKDAALRKADQEIERILDEWADIVGAQLRELAGRADLIR